MHSTLPFANSGMTPPAASSDHESGMSLLFSTAVPVLAISSEPGPSHAVSPYAAPCRTTALSSCGPVIPQSATVTLSSFPLSSARLTYLATSSEPEPSHVVSPYAAPCTTTALSCSPVITQSATATHSSLSFIYWIYFFNYFK